MTRRSCPDLFATALRFWVAGLFVALSACSRGEGGTRADVTLVLAAYSAPREALEREVIPGFQAWYQAERGKTIRVEASYLASGAQARAVLGGFPADVVALALDPDVEKIAAAGLITHDWRQGRGGAFATTTVAFAVRPGNPKAITGWADLARPGIGVLLPSPRTSGGAMWNVNALYGAALRGHAGVAANDPKAAQAFLDAVLRNVVIMDKGARESMITFENGIGDVAITYESEVFAARLAGREVELVVPSSTLLVEAATAVVDEVAERHHVREPARDFVTFIQSTAGQAGFGKYGFRREDAGRIAGEPPSPARRQGLFDVRDLGGWPHVLSMIYGPNGVFTQTWEDIYARED